MLALRPLIPLIAAAGILLAGNGLQGTLIAIRGADEVFQLYKSLDWRGLFFRLYDCDFGCLALVAGSGSYQAVCCHGRHCCFGYFVVGIMDRPIVMVFVARIDGILFCLSVCNNCSWINSGVSNEIRGKGIVCL